MLVSVNIPLKKINNPKFKNFLERHMGRSLPDESTLRKHYIPVCYNETMARIRDEVRGKKIFVSIDETSDAEGRYVANVIVGTLELDGPGKTFLLTSEILEKVNNSSICILFGQSMFLLWPNPTQHT